MRCAAFLAFWVLLCQPLRLVWGSYPSHPAPTRDGDELRLIGDDSHFDHVMMLTDAEALDEAAKADIMFAGNSRVQFGIDFNVVVKELEEVGARPYWLSFPYEERARFLRDVMEAGDLHPRLLVLHVDGITFDRDYSRYWEHYRELGIRRAALEDAKIKSRNDAWRAFMRVVPLKQLEFRSSWLKWIRVPAIYRSINYGDWTVAYPGLYRYEAKLYRPANPKNRKLQGDLLRAHEFVEFCRERGTEVVFMTVPNPTSNEVLAHQLGRRMRVSVLPIEWGDMNTFDFSHLEPDSARRNTKRVMIWLRETREWRRTFGQAEEPDF